MREISVGQERFRAIIAFGMFLIMMSSSLAYPLNAGNGMVNATVYGVMSYEYGNGLYVDISASDEDVYEVELIDSNNDTFSGDSGPYRSTLHGSITETKHNGFIRDILLFDVPKDALIKSFRIIPLNSDPFYINWTDMPMITGQNVALRFLGATFEPNGMRWLQGNWNLDVSITDTANQTAEYNSSDFALIDQFGWEYQGEEGGSRKVVPAGKSLRFSVKVPFVSELSRPVAIQFKGMMLNISAWA
jgi:hypothetical protein